MPGTHPPVTLHLQPHALPAVRAALEEALTELSGHLYRLTTSGFIPEAWLGDPVSAIVQTHYNRMVMRAADGPYAVMVAYELELTRIRNNVKAMEDHYHRTEGDNAAQWGRL